jgi:hypothetical protein
LRHSDQLAEEVEAELDKAILSVRRVVGTLNGVGHHLEPEYPPEPGDVSYRDHSGDGLMYRCMLRLGVDTTVSTGYAHLVDSTAEPYES